MVATTVCPLPLPLPCKATGTTRPSLTQARMISRPTSPKCASKTSASLRTSMLTTKLSPLRNRMLSPLLPPPRSLTSSLPGPLTCSPSTSTSCRPRLQLVPPLLWQPRCQRLALNGQPGRTAVRRSEEPTTPTKSSGAKTPVYPTSTRRWFSSPMSPMPMPTLTLSILPLGALLTAT